MKKYRFIVRAGWSTGDYWDFDNMEDGIRFIKEVRSSDGINGIAPVGVVAIVIQETQEEITRI